MNTEVIWKRHPHGSHNFIKVNQVKVPEEVIMRKLVIISTFAIVLSAPVFSADEHDHEAVSQSGEIQGGMMMGMMNSEQMMAMQAGMEEMQRQMSEIMQESNPERRQQLMQQHMAARMSMMHRMMGMPENEDLSNIKIKNQMSIMRNQMSMMQMMMGQMMGNTAEESGSNE